MKRAFRAVRENLLHLHHHSLLQPTLTHPQHLTLTTIWPCHLSLESRHPTYSPIWPIDLGFHWLHPTHSISCPFFFFFCVPGHARFSVRWVRRSPQSAAVSQPVPKASCGPPPDWAMSGVSSHRRWGRIAGCGWGFEDPCRMDIRLSGKFSVCGGGRGVDSVQFSV